MGFLTFEMAKVSPVTRDPEFDPWISKIPAGMAPTPELLLRGFIQEPGGLQPWGWQRAGHH